VFDTLKLYKAIRTANPGGLGKIDKYDINDPKSIKELKEDNINLKEIFELSKKYDLISREYADGYPVIFKLGLPYFLERFDVKNDINVAIVDTFLKILSQYPDTLIIRKSTRENANMVSKSATSILKKGGISNKEGFKATIEFDKFLNEKEGKLNPGTTADILAGIIFCSLVSGIRF
jgi:triphosphoribosyl-dephospho-CoA synthase